MWFVVNMKYLILAVCFTSIQATKLDFDILTDYNVNDCLRNDNDEKLKYFDLDSDGFPYCSRYRETLDCDPNDEGSCEPGLKCSSSGKCQLDTSSCFKYYAAIEGNKNVKKLLWTPDCQGHGDWAPKQCKGGVSGRCFCYSSKGQRIHGDAFAESSANMTCACSRRRAELLDTSNSISKSYVSLHCDHLGNFEELQCDSGHCWCADPKTGDLKSAIVPEKALQYLKCANKLKNTQYLRKCESQAAAQAKQIDIMIRHGTTSPNIQKIKCRDSGNYGPYTIEQTSATCVTTANKKLPYSLDVEDISEMDCNCAYDQNLYSSLGKPFSLKCSSNGNYEPFQKVYENDQVKKFCVDKDGNKKVDNIETQSDCKQFYD